MATVNLTKLAKLLVRVLRCLFIKREINEHDFIQFFQRSIKDLFYLTRHHAIIKRRLLKKNGKTILQHNYMKHTSKSKEAAKKVKRKKLEASFGWSKRIVIYLKRKRMLARLNSKETSKLEPDVIQKLNERLNNYKKNSLKISESEQFGEIVDSRPVDSSSLEAGNSAVILNPVTSQNGLEQNAKDGSTTSTLNRTTFLDSLINKLRTDAPKIVVRPHTKQIKTTLNSKYDQNKSIIDSESSNSSDFFGFNDVDPCTGLLPTPAVRIQSEKSVFISEQLDAFLRENSLENRSHVELPNHQTIEEGLVCVGALPPKIQMQRVPDNFAKARTVAEKRIILEKTKNVKYFIIENENTIYRELKKRAKYGQVNQNLLSNLLKTEMPFTRDCWKATSWLRTSNGNYCFQTLKVNGKEYKLIGTQGNHREKILGIVNNAATFKRYRKGCPAGCKQSVEFKGLKIRFPEPTVRSIQKLRPKHSTLLSSIVSEIEYKPGPLSKKCQSRSEDKEVDEIKIYKMPNVQLEVHPKVNQPLDERVKPYLKLICPSERISREWAEFAVSTLVLQTKTSDKKSEKHIEKSFTFDIPYLNEQKTVLVRQLSKRKEKFDPNIHGTKMTFRSNVNSANALEVACADALTEMIDCVALSLCEDSLIQNDPLIDYTQNKIKDECVLRDVDNKQQIEIEKSPKSDSTNKNKPPYRLLKELKRLNATIVGAESNLIAECDKCDEPFCQLGCVCHSLMSSKLARTHCKKVDCMLNCTCANMKSNSNSSDGHLSKEDAFFLREQATARLAKVEKEFCSTVVLTGDQPVLIHESQTEKRRTKRVPKRYSDSEFIREDSISTGREQESDEPVTIDTKLNPDEGFDSPLKVFKHCTVNVPYLECAKSIESWCMVHCLYRCYCKGKAVEGEPFKFDEGVAIEEEEVLYSRKRRYSFDKEESAPPSKVATKRKYYSAVYYRGGRTSEIPTEFYLKFNRKKAADVRARIVLEETQDRMALLHKRIIECKQYSADIFNKNENKAAHLLREHGYPKSHGIEKDTIPTKPNPSLSNSVRQPMQSQPLEKKNTELIKALHNTNIRNCEDLSSKTFKTESSDEGVASSSASLDDSIPKMPVITSVVSLHNNNHSSYSKRLTYAETFHKKTINLLNMAVTNTMRGICNILSQDLQHIPTPAPGTLCSATWWKFLQAFQENRIFIWDVMVENHGILVATKTSIMPQVPGALCAANIKILNRGNLPLLAQMLVDGTFVDSMKTMAVLMVGETNYWHVIGCTRSKTDYSTLKCVVKPTPISHPQVSAKVNELYQLLLTREVQDLRETYANTKQTPPSPSNVIPSSTPLPECESEQDTAKSEPKLNEIQTNLEFKSLTRKEAESIVIPIPNEKDHFWLMISVGNDFSHIFMPQWKDFLSYERIKRAFSMAVRNRIVRIAQYDGNAYIYAPPSSLRRLFIGPFYERSQIRAVLCQTVGGKIISREDYEKMKNIRHVNRTVAHWLEIKNSTLVLTDSCRAVVERISVNKISHGSSLLKRKINAETVQSPIDDVQRKSPKSEVNILPSFKSSTKGFVPLEGLIGKDVIITTKPNHKTASSKAEESSAQHLSANSFSSTSKSLASYKLPISSITKSAKEKAMKSALFKINRSFQTNSASDDRKLIKNVSAIQSEDKQNVPNLSPKTLSPDESLLKNSALFNGPADVLRVSPKHQPKVTGYFISQETTIGKVLAHKTSVNYFIKFWDKSEWWSFVDEQAVSRYLTRFVTKHTNGKYSNLTWRYVAIGPKQRIFPLLCLERLKKMFTAPETVSCTSDKISETITSARITSPVYLHNARKNILPRTVTVAETKLNGVTTIISKMKDKGLNIDVSIRQKMRKPASDVILIDD